MAPSKFDSLTKKGKSDENEPSPTPKPTVDATKLNELMVNLDKRLAGGLHGEYYETGSRLDDKNRHGQLETVFNLRKELAEIKTQIEKQSDPEQGKPGKGGAVTGNKNMIATIKNVVAQELSEKLRDLSVRNERLEATGEKAQARIDSLEGKIETLETKLKKAEERNQSLQEKFSNSHVHVVETKVKKVEAEIATLRAQLASTERNLTSTVDIRCGELTRTHQAHELPGIRRSINNLETRMLELEDRAGVLEDDVEELQDNEYGY